MCKFTNRLFVFALLLVGLGRILAQPVGGKIKTENSRNVVSDLLEVLYDDYSENGFQREDILYDQRQKGAENYQFKVDGVVIGLAPQLSSSLLYSMAESYLSKIMLRQSTPDPESTQMYDRDPETDTDSGPTEGVTKIPELAQIDLESRQHQIVASQTASRSPTQLLQLLKMLKSSKA